MASGALGSCIAFAAIDTISSSAAMAHIMLPGKYKICNKPSLNKYKYVCDSVDATLYYMEKLYNASKSKLVFVAARCSNVLKNEAATICDILKKSFLEKLKIKSLNLAFNDFGGYERKRLIACPQAKKAFLSVGNSTEKCVLSIV